jgi:hypothetical protein
MDTYNLMFRERRKAQKLCQDCPATITEFTRCAACRKKRASYHRRKTQTAYLAARKAPMSLYAGTRPCIRCDESFESWDKRKNQLCQKCTVEVEWLNKEASYG